MNHHFRRATPTYRVVIGLLVVYLVAISIYMLAHGQWFSYDQFFIAALLGTILLGRMKQFLLDWIPFLGLLFGYDLLRGLVPTMTKVVHITPMIRLDQAIFGFIPTLKLQALLSSSTTLHWYDFLAVVLYMSHFVIPMLASFAFWLYDRKFFRDYALGILILSYACFITYLAYPAMPPWMASGQGYLPPVKNIMGEVMNHFLPPRIQFPTLFALVDADPVAAVPSLHAAYPFLVFLFVRRRVGAGSLVMLPYVLGVWFAVLYLGEHYFTDVLLGILYALAAYLLVTRKEHLWVRLTWLTNAVRSARKEISLPPQEP